MAPRHKYTREEIIDAALDLVSEKGIEALTAREVGIRLGVSASPIFTAFKNMEEVHNEVRSAARKRFQTYADKATLYTPEFKQMGMQMILFAMEEPRLFELLFMKNEGIPHLLDEGYLTRDPTAAKALNMIQTGYGLTEDEAKTLFHHAWIFTFGIGALLATGMCRFSLEEINELLGQEFMAMLARIKSGGLKEPTVRPVLKKE